MIPGFTDATAYARLGAKCYGFAPIRFDAASNVSFSRMYHGDDERIPVEGSDGGCVCSTRPFAASSCARSEMSEAYWTPVLPG